MNRLNIKLVSAEVRTKFDLMNAERERMAKQIEELSGMKSKIIIYIIIAVVIGVVLGMRWGEC